MFTVLLSVFLATAPQQSDHWVGKEYADHSASQKRFADDSLQKLNFVGDEKVLDVGCGDGKITAQMAVNVPAGAVMGVDISKSMIEFAQKTFVLQKNLSFQEGDAELIDFHEKFDLITSFTVMQWVLEQAKALKAFERALKPGGRVLIQMPTALPAAMSAALDKILAKAQWKGYFTHYSPPWRFYNEDEYRPLLKQAGFNLTRLELSVKDDIFPSRQAFHGFMRQIFPYLRALPEDLKDPFLTQLIDAFLEILPPDSQGRIHWIVDRMEVEAVKR